MNPQTEVHNQTVRIPTLTLQMLENSPGQYNVYKGFAWSRLLKGNQVPVTWNEPTEEGTDVNVINIFSDEEIERAAQVLLRYMNSVKTRRIDEEKD